MIETTRLFQDGMLYRFRVSVNGPVDRSNKWSAASPPWPWKSPSTSRLASRDREGFIRVPERLFLPIEQYDWLHDTLIGRRPYYERIAYSHKPGRDKNGNINFANEYFVYFRRYEDAFNYCMRWRSE